SLNYPLTTGDRLWTDKGARAELETGNIAIRISEQTDLTTTNLTDQLLQLGLAQGSLRISAYALRSGHEVEVDTPGAAVTILQPGSYRVDVYPDQGRTLVTVNRGEVQITGNGLNETVQSGQAVMLTGTDQVQASAVGVPGPDSFDQWCAQRDRKYENARSRQYVSPYVPGYYDLDGYGDWTTVAEYGPIWYPSGLAVGWCPYRFGRWAWVEPWGWTWIDDAPWGFAPFHYGRWAYASRGWVWVPGTMVARPVYAPALVVFVGGNNWSPAAGDGIGWFPLGPHEPYVPPYTASPGYAQRVNATHVSNFQGGQSYDVTRATYVNRNVPQAVTVVHRDDFVQSRRTSTAIVAVPFAEVGRAPVMG